MESITLEMMELQTGHYVCLQHAVAVAMSRCSVWYWSENNECYNALQLYELAQAMDEEYPVFAPAFYMVSAEGAIGKSDGLEYQTHWLFTPAPQEDFFAKAQAEIEEMRTREEAEQAEVRMKAAEAEARRQAEEEEALRRQAAEAEARRKAEEAARRKAEEEAARRKAEEEAAARKKAAEEEARKQAEAEARRKAEAEARKKAAEEEAARKQAEDGQPTQPVFRSRFCPSCGTPYKSEDARFCIHCGTPRK